jgi:beta-hydroxylase
MSVAASKNIDSKQVGFVNILFTFVYHLRSKVNYRSIYYIGKWVLILDILWLLFW